MRKSATALLFKIKDRFGFPALQDMLAKVPQSTLESLKEDIPEVSSLIKTKKKEKKRTIIIIVIKRRKKKEEDGEKNWLVDCCFDCFCFCFVFQHACSHFPTMVQRIYW